MDLNWVLSILGTLVLGVAANLLTAPIQNWLGRLSRRRAQRRIAQLEAELAQLQELHDHPIQRQMALLRQGLEGLMALAIGGGLGLLALDLQSDPATIAWHVSNILLGGAMAGCGLAAQFAFMALRTDFRAADLPGHYRPQVERVI